MEAWFFLQKYPDIIFSISTRQYLLSNTRAVEKNNFCFLGCKKSLKKRKWWIGPHFHFIEDDILHPQKLQVKISCKNIKEILSLMFLQLIFTCKKRFYLFEGDFFASSKKIMLFLLLQDDFVHLIFTPRESFFSIFSNWTWFSFL